MIFNIVYLFIFASCYGVPLESPSADLSSYFNSRIVGGEVIPISSAPYMVGLRQGNVFLLFVCGGSIITERHVLSAAHCLEGYIFNGNLIWSFHIIAGTDIWWRGGTEITPATFDIHPQYHRDTFKFDATILTLSTKLDFKRGPSKPIALDFGKQPERVDCSVAGWGSTEAWGPVSTELRKLHVSTIPHHVCEALIIKKAINANLTAIPVDPDSEICTLHSPGFGVCHGDSGSALISKWSRGQIGIVSWGKPCAVGAPDIYTSVRAIKYFILCILQGRGCHIVGKKDRSDPKILPKPMLFS